MLAWFNDHMYIAFQRPIFELIRVASQMISKLLGIQSRIDNYEIISSMIMKMPHDVSVYN